MTDTKSLHTKLFNRSIMLLDDVLEYLNEEENAKAIDSYNLILKAFEAIKLFDYNIKGGKFNELVTEIEKNHKSIILLFESKTWDELTPLIKDSVAPLYKSLKSFNEDYYIYKEFGVDTNWNQFYTIKEAGLIDNPTAEDAKIVSDFWETHLGVEVDQSIHHAFKTLTGRLDPRILPQIQLNMFIVPFMNISKVLPYYNDKNIYSILMHGFKQPEAVLKRIKGNYFDSENNTITRSKAFSLLFNEKEDLILKESNADDGKAVKKLVFNKHKLFLNEHEVNLSNIEKIFGDNFIIQRVIKQHPTMAAPHPYSVNTLRMITLRFKDEIHYLCGYGKFGSNKSVIDNAVSGGISVAVNERGEFNNWGLDAKAVVHHKHPSTGFDLNALGAVPNYSNVIEFTKALHERIPHAHYVSWDIAIDELGDPVFIEMNFRGKVWQVQLITERPIFGDLTEEILLEIKKHKDKEEGKQK